MPILAMSSGTVTAVWGQAFLRLPNGQLRAVKVGDKVVGGQQIVTEDDGLVQIAPDRVPVVAAPVAKPATDAVIADLNRDEPLEPTAAGLQGGGGASLSQGLRVDRIAEGVTPLVFDFGTERVLPPPILAVTAPQASLPATVAPQPVPPVVPGQPQLSVNSVTVNEGAGVATFTVSLSQPSREPVTVTVSTRSGTAAVGTGEGADAGALTQTITFAPNETSQTVAVPIVNDRTYEGAETFAVVLSEPVNATISQGTGTGTIVDDGTGSLGPNQTVADDDRPVLGIAAGPNVVEGDKATFTLSLDHPSNFPVGVSLKLLTGGIDPVTGQSKYITPGTDSTPLEVFNAQTGQWEVVNGPVVFAPGQTTLQLRVPTTNDGLVEGNELVGLQATVDSGVTAPGAAPVSAEVLVLDNDAQATVFESGLYATTPAGTTRAEGAVPLTNAQGQPVAAVFTAPTVALTTEAGQPVVWSADGQGGLVGRAGAGPDAPVVATLSLAPGGRYAFDLLQPLQHPAGQANLVLDFGVSPAVAGSVPAGTLSVQVIDAQPPVPAISVNSVTVNEGAGVATFTLTLDQASPFVPVTVQFKTEATPGAGQATSGTDFTDTAGSVTFQPGQSTVTVTVPIANDGTYEGPEAFRLVLSNPVNATVSQGTGTGTIVDDGTGSLGPNQTVADDDRPVLGIAAGPNVVEGDKATFTLSLDHPSNFPVGVSLKLLTGGIDPVTGQSKYITPGTDSTPLEVFNAQTGQWEVVNGPVVFAPGQTTLQLRVPTTNDGLVEGNELVGLQATVDSGVTAPGAAPVSAEVLVLDNDAQATVFESGLFGTTPTATARTEGVLPLVDAQGQPVAATVTPPTLAVAAMSGPTVVWSSDGQGGLVGRAGTEVVATLSLLSNGRYVFDLLQPLQHTPGQPELVLDFGVAPNAAGSVPGGTLNIRVIDAQPSVPAVSVDSVTVNEGAGVATFTISLDKASPFQPVTVQYKTEALGTAGSATPSKDYTDLLGAVTFQPGETSIKVTVPILNDGTYEGPEPFRIVLTDVVNATVSQGTGTATIVDDGTGSLGPNQAVADDDRPAVKLVAGPTVVEGAPATFTVSLTQPSNFPVSVALKLIDGQVDPVTGQSTTVTPGIDSTPLEFFNTETGQWQLLSGPLVFAPGQTNIQVRVPTLNDGRVEGTELVQLQATVESGVVVGGNGPFSADVAVRDNDAEGTVYEAGLSGRTDPSPTTVTGKLNVVDADGQVVPVTLKAPPEALVSTNNGQPVTWASDGQGGLIGRAGTTADAPVVATVKVTADGNYTFSLLQPVQHAAGSNLIDLHFSAQPATAGTTATDGTLTIHLVDALPRAPAAVDLQASALDTNLLIVLDTSNSMNAASGFNDLTRLQAAVQSITKLLDRYDQFGDVAVRLVTFADVGKAQGDRWLSVSDAKALLAGLTTNGTGFTNYDDALASARVAFDTPDGKLGNAQNVSYFLSDGNPTLSSDFPKSGPATFIDASGQQVTVVQNGTTQPNLGDGLSAQETDSWVAFLNARQIKSYAVGMGTEVTTPFLSPIAYDGQASSDLAGVVATSFADLQNVLDGSTRDLVAGRLLATATGAGAVIGADGFDHVGSITIGNRTFDHVPGQGVITVDTIGGGKFTIDMQTSAYSYAAPSGDFGSLQEEIGFTLVDRDGDAAKSVLRINVDHTQVQVGTDEANALNAGTNSQFMMGRDGSDALTGGAGADVLLGNGGKDVLLGGAGRDILVGGSGNDTLTGGADGDVFAWRFSDAGIAGAPAVDHITDFATALPPKGGDALDLRDLLQGEHAGTGSYNLDQFLHVTLEGGSTVVRVSTAGDFSATDASAGTETQRIVLDNVDLFARLGSGATEQLVIAKLLEQGKLLVDA
jgi:Calx-beta domain/von Willebrand factor type A domain/RTX calcium-binding nonapeptide repeat (4 copies)